MDADRRLDDLELDFFACADDGAATDGGSCVPGMSEACACAGQGMGARVCEPDGMGFGECVCEDGETGDSSGDGDPRGDGDGDPSGDGDPTGRPAMSCAR